MSYIAPPEQAQPRWSLRARPRQRWVGFEGIVASGKSTQARLLAEGLRCSVEVVPEFGDHELGRYLSEYGSPGMRLTPEGCDATHVRHLLALSSHVQKLRDVRTAKNVVLLDVATLTDTAYALADLPQEAAAGLRTWMCSAVNALIEPVRPAPRRGVLIYLDCDPKIAADRLARRTSDEVGTEQIEFLVRMHEAYEFLLSEREDVVRVDANGAVDEVAEAVRAHVRL
jgi:thymidylate kinase